MIYEAIIFARNGFSRIIYAGIFKKIFFRRDPEEVHERIRYLGIFLGSNFLTRFAVRMLFSYGNKKLEQNILGIKFLNPVGLAAGFDKNAELTNIIPSVGFGFEEVGSITGEPCDGNLKPRLWRLPKSRALAVYYGLVNKGCEVLSEKLRGKKFKIPIGISVAKTNSPDTVDTTVGVKDYVKAFSRFSDIGDYFTVNISCPNAYGGEPFTDADKLDVLLMEIDKIPTSKPVFLKLAPDLDEKQIDDLLKTAERHRVHGFICTNLTKNRNNPKILEACPPKGGLSGKVVEDLSNSAISYIYKKTKGKYVIIGVGGIFSAEDAYKKIKLGASLVQLLTGMIFEGPQLISEINQGLARLLKKDGFKNISEAVGIDN